MKNISNNLKFIAKIKNKLFPFLQKKEVKELFKIINKGEPKDKKTPCLLVDVSENICQTTK